MKDYKIERAIEESVDDLIDSLLKKEEIIRYQKVEKQVEKNEWLKELIESIKQKQRDLVNLEYYEKPLAYQKTLKELEELNRQLAGNITVQLYKETLWEANEIVQLLFSRIQDAVSDLEKEQ